MSPVFHPAMAIYSMAEAASEAENFVFAPISRAFSRSLSRSSPAAPDTAATLLMPESKSAATFTAAAPRPPTAAVTGISFLPAPSMEEPTLFSFSPVSPIFCKATADLPACVSSSSRAFSVSTISLCRASYWLWEISPLASASLACCPASFKASSFSFVSPTACARSLCFCAISSVFPRSSFNSLFTSLSCPCVSRISLFTFDKAVDSFVVSPPISTVIPWILDATLPTCLSATKKRALTGSQNELKKRLPFLTNAYVISFYHYYIFKSSGICFFQTPDSNICNQFQRQRFFIWNLNRSLTCFIRFQPFLEYNNRFFSCI